MSNPSHSPSQHCPLQACTTQTEPEPKKRRAPGLGTYNAYVPPGFQHHHVPSDMSQVKRSHLNHLALSTPSDAMRFHRIVEWDGSWLSTLSLPPLEFFRNVVYFESIFPNTYPIDGGVARLQQVWLDGPERRYGHHIYPSEAMDSDLLLEEECFDFARYYGEEGEPVETVAEKAAWQAQSQKLRSMICCTSAEALLRVENETHTRWSNQR